MYELVSPDGRLYRVPEGQLTDFCERHGLERPDNVGRLSGDNCSFRFSQNWQALNKVRWLQFVHPKTLLPIDGVEEQPVLGETGYFLEHHAPLNPKMSKIVNGKREHIFSDKEFSRLLGKSPPSQYKGWARCYPGVEEARAFFVRKGMVSSHQASYLLGPMHGASVPVVGADTPGWQERGDIPRTFVAPALATRPACAGCITWGDRGRHGRRLCDRIAGDACVGTRGGAVGSRSGGPDRDLARSGAR